MNARRLDYMGRRKSDPVALLGFNAMQTLYGGPWYTVGEIGERAGITPSRVQQLEIAACRKVGRMLVRMRHELRSA